MFTLFTTAKPFIGQIDTNQRNALKSWSLLHPDVEVILFGDDPGAAEAALELGIRHDPHVERNEAGSKRIDQIFDRAEEIARHDVLCYVNCDIILTSDFAGALARVRAAHQRFLMIGRRWDTDIAVPLDFEATDWEPKVLAQAHQANCRRSEWFIDYFAFSRGLYHKRIPPLVIGRVFWDNWLIWHARRSNTPVIDVSPVVHAVHQNHDYSYHSEGQHGVWNDQQALINLKQAGGWGHLRGIADATEILGPEGLRPNRKRHWQSVKHWAAALKRLVRRLGSRPNRLFEV
jgi:hypothetical protein